MDTLSEAESLLKAHGITLDGTRLELARGVTFHRMGRLDDALAAFQNANTLHLQLSYGQNLKFIVDVNIASVYIDQAKFERASPNFVDVNEPI